jgi:KaiC/GvpD/RAD55 family RecA-like ATPase
MPMKESSRSKIGVTGLDEILHGGLIPARLYLIDGNPGAGKTTLALHFLQEGVRAAVTDHREVSESDSPSCAA